MKALALFSYPSSRRAGLEDGAQYGRHRMTRIVFMPSIALWLVIVKAKLPFPDAGRWWVIAQHQAPRVAFCMAMLSGIGGNWN